MSDRQHIQFGSLLCSVEEDSGHWAEILAEVNGTPLFAPIDDSAIGLKIRFQERTDLSIRGNDELNLEPTSDGFVLDSDPLNIRLQLKAPCPEAIFEVKQPKMPREQLGFHIWLVTNRMLILLDRMLLHCAAIEMDGLVALFCGRRGAGKSTISISLAQAGATILAEDHVILRHVQGDYSISGCTSRVRVTAKTEEHLLPGQLKSAPLDVGGVDKKDFPAEQFYRSLPYIDRKPDLLLLSRVGEKFAVSDLPKSEALIQLMKVTGEMLRFSSHRDYETFFDTLAGFVQTVPTFSLELSPDLSHLGGLHEWLQQYPKRD
ncbi:MAG: hypothetical protein AAGC68_11910 [Verrucomicrobiota bacterium]